MDTIFENGEDEYPPRRIRFARGSKLPTRWSRNF